MIRSKRLKLASKIMLMMKNPRSKNMSYDQIHKIKTKQNHVDDLILKVRVRHMNKITSIKTDEHAITTISTKLGLPSY